jgi:zinc transport system ATP-binding protein
LTNACHMGCKPANGKCGACCTKIEYFGVSYGKTEILKNVNLHIHCGELTAIIGPNGAGKSTLLKAILGEVKHTGTMTFLSCRDARKQHPVIGYVPQHFEFDTGLPVSVMDFFAACSSNMPVWIRSNLKIRDKLLKCLARVNAEYLADKRLGDLSGGELQRVMLALALEPIPDILLLDEPISGVDRKGIEFFYNTVSELRQKYDLSIILVSHDFDLVSRYADRVVLLYGTVECVGTPEQVFASEKARERFGEAISAAFSPARAAAGGTLVETEEAEK